MQIDAFGAQPQPFPEELLRLGIFFPLLIERGKVCIQARDVLFLCDGPAKRIDGLVHFVPFFQHHSDPDLGTAEILRRCRNALQNVQGRVIGPDILIRCAEKIHDSVFGRVFPQQSRQHPDGLFILAPFQGDERQGHPHLPVAGVQL